MASASPLDSFLGNGIIRPFQRDKKNDFANASGARLVRSTVGQVLGTQAQGETANGELPWRHEFGSLIYLLKHRKGRLVAELGRQYAQDALAKWEPRVVITQVDPVFDSEARAVSFKLTVDLISENAPGNQVLIPGVEIEIPII